jgi:hypothetical protein
MHSHVALQLPSAGVHEVHSRSWQHIQSPIRLAMALVKGYQAAHRRIYGILRISFLHFILGLQYKLRLDVSHKISYGHVII